MRGTEFMSLLTPASCKYIKTVKTQPRHENATNVHAIIRSQNKCNGAKQCSDLLRYIGTACEGCCASDLGLRTFKVFWNHVNTMEMPVLRYVFEYAHLGKLRETMAHI